MLKKPGNATLRGIDALARFLESLQISSATLPTPKRRLDLYPLDSDKLKQIADTLSAHDCVNEIILSGCDVSIGLNTLTDALAKTKHLEALVLENNPNFGTQGTKLLSDALKVTPTLHRVSLWKNAIGAQGGSILGQMLASHGSLTHLDISCNAVGRVGGVAIADALKTNRSLTYLNIGGNDIGQQGGIAFGMALSVNSTLKTLNLQWNDIGEQGGIAIGQALTKNNTLTSLDLRWNNIGLDGSDALLNSFNTNKTLVELELCGFGTHNMASVQAALTVFVQRNRVRAQAGPQSDEGAKPAEEKAPVAVVTVVGSAPAPKRGTHFRGLSLLMKKGAVGDAAARLRQSTASDVVVHPAPASDLPRRSIVRGIDARLASVVLQQEEELAAQAQLIVKLQTAAHNKGSTSVPNTPPMTPSAKAEKAKPALTAEQKRVANTTKAQAMWRGRKVRRTLKSVANAASRLDAADSGATASDVAVAAVKAGLSAEQLSAMSPEQRRAALGIVVLKPAADDAKQSKPGTAAARTVVDDEVYQRMLERQRQLEDLVQAQTARQNELLGLLESFKAKLDPEGKAEASAHEGESDSAAAGGRRGSGSSGTGAAASSAAGAKKIVVPKGKSAAQKLREEITRLQAQLELAEKDENPDFAGLHKRAGAGIASKIIRFEELAHESATEQQIISTVLQSA